MKLIYSLVRKKYTRTDSKHFYSLSRESKEEKKIHFERKGYVSQCILGKMFCDIYTKREFQSICSSHKGGDMSARISLNFPLSLFLNGTQWKALLIRGICWIIYCKHDNVIIVHAGPQGPAHFLLCVCRTAADNAFSRITLIPANIKTCRRKIVIISASWPCRLILLCLTAGRDLNEMKIYCN